MQNDWVSFPFDYPVSDGSNRLMLLLSIKTILRLRICLPTCKTSFLLLRALMSNVWNINKGVQEG